MPRFLGALTVGWLGAHGLTALASRCMPIETSETLTLLEAAVGDESDDTDAFFRSISALRMIQFHPDRSVLLCLDVVSVPSSRTFAGVDPSPCLDVESEHGWGP